MIMPKIHDARAEKFVAIGSFLVAAVLAFIGQHMAKEGDIAGGTLMMCAQFLTLCATIFGVDYNFRKHTYGNKDNQNPTGDKE